MNGCYNSKETTLMLGARGDPTIESTVFHWMAAFFEEPGIKNCLEKHLVGTTSSHRFISYIFLHVRIRFLPIMMKTIKWFSLYVYKTLVSASYFYTENKVSHSGGLFKN